MSKSNVVPIRREEHPAPTEPFEDIEPEGLDVTVPVIALALFAALLAFYWLVDNGLPQLFPM